MISACCLFLLGALSIANDPSFYYAPKTILITARMCKLINVFIGHICQKDNIFSLRLNLLRNFSKTARVTWFLHVSLFGVFYN